VSGGQRRLGAVWPLFDLVVRTPRLELRLPREDEFPDLVALVDAGVHDPDTMPFFVPWTDREPARRARESAQWFWGQRANWSPDKWTFTEEALSGAFEDNAPSRATSRSVGYVENGEARAPRRDGSGRTIRFRLDRATWERQRREDIEIDGLDSCLDMFIGSPPSSS